jgi:pimeloyl-ACP methyl ester carboxylesterase
MTTTLNAPSPATRNPTSGRAPVWFRGAMGALSHTAPPLAAVVAERFFLTVPARPLKPAERANAESARRVALDTPSGPIEGWRWGDAPETVLLVHGWGGRGPQLSEIAKALVARGYSALAWDMPGHGEQPRNTNLPELARVTAAVARQSGPIAGVVAHSFGLATTLVATREGLIAPRLVGVAGSALLHKIAGQFGDLTGFTPRVVERMRANLSARLGFSWDELEAATLAPPLGIPALLIHDRQDERVPFDHAVELSGLLSAELVPTSGLGHSAILNDPTVVARVAEFFPPAAARPQVR